VACASMSLEDLLARSVEDAAGHRQLQDKRRKIAR